MYVYVFPILKYMLFLVPSDCCFFQMEYRAEKKAKKKAYAALKQIARQQGKRPPPNRYPSFMKEIKAMEKKCIYDRFHNPRIRQILQILQDEKAVEDQARMRGGWGGGGSRGGGGGGGWVAVPVWLAVVVVVGVAGNI